MQRSPDVLYDYYYNTRDTDHTDDNNPIAQIPPLGGTPSLEYTRNEWNLGALLRADASQHRVEDNPARNSGMDAGITPGWAVFDVFGSYEGLEYFTLAAGVNNVLDRTYADDVNKANVDPFNPDAVQVNVAHAGKMPAWIRLESSGKDCSMGASSGLNSIISACTCTRRLWQSKELLRSTDTAQPVLPE